MRGDYEEMDPAEGRRGIDWGVAVAAGVAVVFVAVLFFASGCVHGAEPPQHPEPPQVTLAAARPKYDPYKVATYREFHERVSRPNGWGTLFVGVPDTAVGTYAPHLWVPSGFGGLADGVYDCWYSHATGRPEMTPRQPAAPVVAAPHPFSTDPPPAPTGATTGTTVAPSAGARNTSSPAPAPGPARTATFALPVIRGGTNCVTGYG